MRLHTMTLTVEGALAEVRIGPARADDAFADRLVRELESAAVLLSDDPAVRCVLLGLPDSPHTHEVAGAARAFQCLEAMARPVIAVIEGACVGPLLELALACDIRVASDAATFAMPQVAAGAMPMHGGTQRLPRLVGRARAAQLILLGDVIDARTAEAWGLVNAVAPAAEAHARARAIAGSICARGPLAIRFAREAMAHGADMPLEQALRYETDLTVILQSTADRAEGVRAFLEKRSPEFEGT